MTGSVFQGCIPALMTPCNDDRTPNFDALARKGKELIDLGMSGVVYCGSMGDWPLLTDEQRQEGVQRLVEAGVPVIVGTGAAHTKSAVAHAAHAAAVGAKGLMVIPRVLSRGSSVSAQRDHFSAILEAAKGLPAVIYNSPYYGFATRADLFFDLRSRFSNLVGFKEFGGKSDMTYAGVYHGFVNCGAGGAITGIGNALPKEVLHLVSLCEQAAKGDAAARSAARELEEALMVLSTYDEGPDLVLHYKYLMVLNGETEYTLHFNETDKLSNSQRHHLENQYRLFKTWYAARYPNAA
jgi:4-hydroxy-tetrahydrodipicolinate synthase